MKILGSQTSPFVRIVRVLCVELDLPYTFELIPPFTKMTPEDVAMISAQNPLMKIPVLIDGGLTLIDSRFIAYYLLTQKSPASTINVPSGPVGENVLTVIYGIMDAGVLRFIMGLDGIDLNRGYMKKSLERILTGLDFLNRQEAIGKNFGLCEIALLCGLEWFDKRNIVDWGHFFHLKGVHDRYRDRPSLVQTRIPADA